MKVNNFKKVFNKNYFLVKNYLIIIHPINYYNTYFPGVPQLVDYVLALQEVHDLLVAYYVVLAHELAACVRI